MLEYDRFECGTLLEHFLLWENLNVHSVEVIMLPEQLLDGAKVLRKILQLSFLELELPC